ncbi:MAG: hypothetical protein IJC43_04645 [Clostridia bacterium]|nr:hypothetical protein [Clostridia bacterium]
MPTEKQSPKTAKPAEPDFREPLLATLDRCADRLNEAAEPEEACDRAAREASRLLIDSMRRQLRTKEEPSG